MLRLILICLLLSTFYAGPTWAEEDSQSYAAPSQLPNVDRAMKTAGFWISRHPSPDNVIMAPDAIDKFNAHIQNDQNLTKNIFTITQDFKTESLIGVFEKTISDLTDKGLYTNNDVHCDIECLEKFKRNMHISGVVLGVGPRYGLVIHYTDQRFLPTTAGLYEEKDDLDFDQLQNSALDIGTPVAVVHTSADGLWYYVLSPLSDGWVKAKDIALGDMNDVKNFVEDKDFVVAIKPKADVFLNDAMTNYYDYVHMGARLPLSSIDEGKVSVNIPTADKDGNLIVKEAYMNSEDVNTGYLPYTARNIYKQAFAMINQPYGWGDSFGEQDCSRFVQMVFATVGVVLPRDSKDQAQVGTQVAELSESFSPATKLDALKQSLGGITLLPMRGHIILYLGTVDDRPYAIHATSGYKESTGDKDVTRTINKVVLSDLSLGEGSARGSLVRRINKVLEVR